MSIDRVVLQKIMDQTGVDAALMLATHGYPPQWLTLWQQGVTTLPAELIHSLLCLHQRFTNQAAAIQFRAGQLIRRPRVKPWANQRMMLFVDYDQPALLWQHLPEFAGLPVSCYRALVQRCVNAAVATGIDTYVVPMVPEDYAAFLAARDTHDCETLRQAWAREWVGAQHRTAHDGQQPVRLPGALRSRVEGQVRPTDMIPSWQDGRPWFRPDQVVMSLNSHERWFHQIEPLYLYYAGDEDCGNPVIDHIGVLADSRLILRSTLFGHRVDLTVAASQWAWR